MRALLSAIAIVLAIVFPVASNAQAARPQLLSPAESPGAKASGTWTSDTALPVRFNSRVMLALPMGAEVELTLPNAETNTYVFEQVVSHGGGISTWIARGKHRGASERAIITTSPAGTWGWMHTPYGEYRIYPGVEHDWLAQKPRHDVAPRWGGTDGPPAPPDDDAAIAPFKGIPTELSSGATSKAGPFAKVTPTPAFQADVMVIYTKDLAQKLGAGLLPMVYNLIASANQAYIDSEVALSLRLVNVTLLDLPNSAGSSDTLDSMANFCNPPTRPCTYVAQFESLTWGASSLRNQVGADFVAVVRDGPDDTGGIGFLLKNPTIYPAPANATNTAAYSVNNYCASGCEDIFAHELGHNMGNAHDRATVSRDRNGVVGGDGTFSYSYGHYDCQNGLTCNPFIPGGCPTNYAQCASLNANDFGTVMSYVRPRVMKFSNPSVLCMPSGGVAPGRPCGLANQDDNARSMNETRHNIAAYRNQAIASLPGSIQFTQTGYSGSESGGTVTFTVSRVGGSSGNVTVDYSVAGATATGGIDFAVAAGTLSWANGDTANKTVVVNLLNDQAAEGVESMIASLSNATGAAGVHIGHPASATGLILEAWPPGGAVPAGWTTPAGSSVPWAVANDTSFDADGTSLKSGAINFAVTNCTGSFGEPLPCPSIVQLSGTFPAGTISYAYRVSSYPGNGFLEFLVDGAVVHQVSGSTGNTSADTGWLLFSTEILAGSHTLQWRYRPGLSFPCKNAVPFGGTSPPYPGCTDRAWIDAVSLPVALAASTTAVASGTNPANSGQSVTFTATVNPGGFGGTVAFFDGGNPIAACQAQPMVAGTATCTTNALSVGSHSITAGYSGTTTVAASLSSAISQTILGVQTLTIAKAGGGAGTVTSNVGGISCGATCSAPYNAGTTVILTAAASGGSIFAGWSGGGCSGLGTCTVTMNANTTVTATFVTVSGSLALTVTPDPLDLGNQAVGATSAARTVTIVNTGTGTVTVSGVAVSGAPFARTHSCTTIAAGASCPVSVTFTPTALGAKAGTLTVTSNAANGPHTVNLAGTGVASASFAANVAAVVTGYYETILGRAPDAGGLTFWSAEATRVTGLGADVREVFFAMSMSFFGSAEYGLRNRTDTEFLTDMYRTFFIRDPDGPGLAFWQGELTAVGSRSALLNSFLFSSEFSTQMASIFGSTPVRPELNMTIDLFRGALGRLPDSGGFNFWLGRIRTAQCQGASAVSTEVNSLAALFFQSAEYTARNRVDRDFMGDVYNAFLRRGPGGDSTGFNFWVGQVGTQGRDFVRSQFVPSAEFQARVAQVIAAGCLP
ncbi:MAG: DUF4214 domain-containing protein [Burkholderiales bacterium]|nr:DUF4214 domain-containing protein [Burkholderiales bacterium]